MHPCVVSGIFCVLCLSLPGTGHATTLNELKVGVRIIDFMTPPPHGRTAVAVIYDGDNDASVADAQTIREWISSGVSSVKAELVPELVEAHRLDHAPACKVAIVAVGTTPALNEPIRGYAVKNHTLTISADMDCLRAGGCAVGVAGFPRVQIVINREATSSQKVEFSEAFRMMAREY